MTRFGGRHQRAIRGCLRRHRFAIRHDEAGLPAACHGPRAGGKYSLPERWSMYRVLRVYAVAVRDGWWALKPDFDATYLRRKRRRSMLWKLQDS
jgi:hypothetical protein